MHMKQQAGTIDAPPFSTGNDSTSKRSSSDYSATAIYLVIAFVAVRVALYLFWGPQYGYFRDEMYYLACGRHPQWSYVDQPPLWPWVAWLLEHTIGTSLYALRFASMMGGVAAIVLTARLAYEFGARRTGIWLAALAALCAPLYLMMAHLFTMNAIDPALWAACALVAIRAHKTGNDRLWLVFGALVGITVLNKYGILFFVAAFLVAMMFTDWRKHLASRWLWLGALLGAAIDLPSFLWQARNHYPFLELMKHVRDSGRDIKLPPLGFMGQQIQMMHPIGFLLVIAALVFFFTRRGREYRVFGITYVIFVAVLMILGAKNYYVGPIYTIMFAAGSVAVEQWFATRARWVPAAYAVLLVATTAILMPIILPVLSPMKYVAYARATHLAPPKFENQREGPLPQLYADMFGWEDKVQLVAKYYQSLPADERAKTAIFANNWGDAAAFEFFGPKYGLPRPISPHQTYWIWGPRGYTGESLLVVDEYDPDHLASLCESITLAADIHHPLARPDSNIPAYHCRGLKSDLRMVWPRIKHYD
jgi:4-amino-4-deoxy-L-arabinose transferase-like glycosyltransferase